MGVELRRYVLAPTERMKEKFTDYGLTTLGMGTREKQQKENERKMSRSRSPLRFDRNIYAEPLSNSALKFSINFEFD